MQEPTMPVRPIHHRGDRQSSVLMYLHDSCFYTLLRDNVATQEFAPTSPDLPLFDDASHITKPPSPSFPLVDGPTPDQTQGWLTPSRPFTDQVTPTNGLARAKPQVKQALSPNKSSAGRPTTFGDLVHLHIDDMCVAAKPRLGPPKLEGSRSQDCRVPCLS